MTIEVLATVVGLLIVAQMFTMSVLMVLCFKLGHDLSDVYYRIENLEKDEVLKPDPSETP